VISGAGHIFDTGLSTVCDAGAGGK
jgi:hypothetical protein